MKREFDLVLFGATGYTGGLVAEYLVKKNPSIAIAIAGRDEAKLAKVDVPFARIRCDAMNASDVDALAKRTRVVCTTVGPYQTYGMPLAIACAENGTHYCDLTGEVPFMRESIDRNHDVAKKSGARIVHACGFDSIPADLGVFATWRAAGKNLGHVRGRYTKLTGGFSGGTVASMFAIMERMSDPKVRRVMGDTHALDPDPKWRRDDRDRIAPMKDERTDHWLGPFLMAGVNTRVVRRSYALLDGAYGPDFRYDESLDHGSGPSGLLHATKMSAFMTSLLGVAIVPGAKSIAKRALPKPGEGPSKEARERGKFVMEIDAEGFRTTISGEQDPGYGETAKMLAESAICLTEDLPSEGGVLTPATAMGDRLLERLRAAKMTFSTLPSAL